jgi:hypothetical protein
LRQAIQACRSGGTAPTGYDLFFNKEDECLKVVLKA